MEWELKIKLILFGFDETNLYQNIIEITFK